MKELSNEVKRDISDFINMQISAWIENAIEYDGMDITFATNDDGDTWNYQTGDNSYTGGAYSLPHWSVSIINTETTVSELYNDVVDQLTELLPDNR